MRLTWGQVLKGLVCHMEFRLYPVGQKEKFGGEERRKYRSLRERLCLYIYLGWRRLSKCLKGVRGNGKMEAMWEGWVLIW